MNVNVGLSFGNLGGFREGVDRSAHPWSAGVQGIQYWKEKLKDTIVNFEYS